MLFTNGSYANAPEVRSGSAWLVIDGEDHVAHGKFRAARGWTVDRRLEEEARAAAAKVRHLKEERCQQEEAERLAREEEAAVHLVQEAEEAACLEAADASQPAEGVEELFEGATTPSKGKKRAREDEGVNAAASKGDRDSSTAPEIDWAQVARRKQQAGEKCDRCRTRT
ncbi:hypothetical protein AcV5_002455 [Taiwanofungus camphoratus]|nr:hypothetical protein AcV5_002455 [Antrodia cinnamomea]